jgi:hypothetical protein
MWAISSPLHLPTELPWLYEKLVDSYFRRWTQQDRTKRLSLSTKLYGVTPQKL